MPINGYEDALTVMDLFLAELTKPSELTLHFSSEEVTELLAKINQENGDEA